MTPSTSPSAAPQTPPADTSPQALPDLVPAQRRQPPNFARAAVAWRDPFEGVSLWDIARMVPRSASRTWRLAWRLDRPMLLVLVAAQLAQGLAAAVMLLATSSAMRPLLGAGTAEHRLRHAAGALVVVAVAAAAGRLATQVAVFCDKRITPIL